MTRLLGLTPKNGNRSGDTMPLYHDGKWHIFISDPPNGKWLFPQSAATSTFHVVSEDLVHWEQVECNDLYPGKKGSYDHDGLWTGCVLEKDGVFHYFYTGGLRTNKGYEQKICHATSDDMINWKKNPNNPILGPDDRYDQIDFRDPAIHLDEEGNYVMIIATRDAKGPAFKSGVLAAAYSKDLINWKLGETFASQHLTHCPECPEYFKLGNYYYLVYSRYSEFQQTFYRVSKNPYGPWESRKSDTLDGRRFYAGKSCTDGKRRMAFAWIPYRLDHLANERWVWGGDIGSPHEYISLNDGTLAVKLPQEVAKSYSKSNKFEIKNSFNDWSFDSSGSINAEAISTYSSCFLVGPKRDDDLLFETNLTINEGTTAAGILLESSNDLLRSYYLSIEPLKSRVILNRWPLTSDPQWNQLVIRDRHKFFDNIFEQDYPLVDRILPELPKNNTYNIKITRKGTNVECWICDQVVASYRIYEEQENMFGLFVQEGSASFNNLEWRT